MCSSTLQSCFETVSSWVSRKHSRAHRSTGGRRERDSSLGPAVHSGKDHRLPGAMGHLCVTKQAGADPVPAAPGTPVTSPLDPSACSDSNSRGLLHRCILIAFHNHFEPVPTVGTVTNDAKISSNS